MNKVGTLYRPHAFAVFLLFCTLAVQAGPIATCSAETLESIVLESYGDPSVSTTNGPTNNPTDVDDPRRFAISWSATEFVDTLTISVADTYECYFLASFLVSYRAFVMFMGDFFSLDSRIQLVSIGEVLGGGAIIEITELSPNINRVIVDAGCVPIAPTQALFKINLWIDPTATPGSETFGFGILRDDSGGLPILAHSSHDCLFDFFESPAIEPCFVKTGIVANNSANWGSVKSLYR